MSHARDFALDGPRGASSPQERLATWYSQGLSDGLGDRLLMFDNSSAPSLELLRFRPELTARPGFEVALRERVRRLRYFHHEAFARVRAVEYLGERDGLALISNFTPGKRLSEVLRLAHGPWLAASLVRQLTPALASLQAQDRGIVHAAVGADRIVVTPEGRLVILEHVLGSALQRLELPADRLAELGIAVPPSSEAKAARLDSRTDFFQLGLVAVSLLLGRPVGAHEFPDKVGELLDQLVSVPGGRTGMALRRWLERALLLNGPAFESGSDADVASQALPSDADVDQSDRLRALLAAKPSAPVPVLPEDIEPPRLAAPQRQELPQHPEPPSVLDIRPATAVRYDTPSVTDVRNRPESPPPPAIEIRTPMEPQTIDRSRSSPFPVAAAKTASTHPAREPVPPPPTTTVTAQPTPPPVTRVELAEPAAASIEVQRRADALSATVVAASSQQGDIRVASPAAIPVPVPAASEAAAPAASLAAAEPPAATPTSTDATTPPATVEVRSDQPDSTVPRRQPAPRERIQRRQPAPKRRPVAAQWFTAIVTGCAIGEALVIVLIVLGHLGTKPADLANRGTNTLAAGPPQGISAADTTSAQDAPAGKTAARGSALAPKPGDAGSVATAGHQPRERGVPGSTARGPAAPSRSSGFKISSPLVLQVYEGDRLLGSTSDGIIAAQPGRREVDLVNTSVGYRARQTVYVRAGTIASIGVSLPSGRVSVNASPWAEVLIDGKSVGETPLGNLSVPIGEHEFVFRHPQLGERRQTATVRADGLTRVTADLQR